MFVKDLEPGEAFAATASTFSQSGMAAVSIVTLSIYSRLLLPGDDATRYRKIRSIFTHAGKFKPEFRTKTNVNDL